jgi:hypothetical protein
MLRMNRFEQNVMPSGMVLKGCLTSHDCDLHGESMPRRSFMETLKIFVEQIHGSVTCGASKYFLQMFF